MAYDNTFKNGVTNKYKFINALWTHLQASYCHYTLTSKVKIVRMDRIIHVDKEMIYTDVLTRDYFNEDTEAILDGAHLVTYFGYKNDYGGSGIASFGTVCSNMQSE